MNENQNYYMEQPIGNYGVGAIRNPSYIPRGYKAFEDSPSGINVGQYFQPDAFPSKYDEELGDINRFISQGRTVDDVRAEKQSGWDMIGNALLNNIVIAGTTAISGTLGLADMILEGTWNNAVNNAMTDLADNSREKFPIYRDQDYENSTLLQKLGTGIFWADLVENLGYTEGMLIPGMGASSLLSSAPKWLATLGGSMIGAIGEASTEAINAKNDEINGKTSLANQRYNELAKYITSDSELESLNEDYMQDLQGINEDARRAGNFVFGSNIALLTLSNAIEFSNLFTRGMGTAKRVRGALKRKGNQYIAESTSSAMAKSAGRNLVNALSEGAEEVSQAVISSLPSNYLDYNSFNASQFNPDKREIVGDLWSALGQSLAETLHDNQTAEEFASGFLIGALGVPTLRRAKMPIELSNNIFMEMGGAYREAQESQRLANLINARLQENDKLGAYYNGLVRHLALQDRMNLALDKDDVYDYKTSEAAQLMSDIRMFDEAGDLEYLKEVINNAVDTSDEGINQLIESTTKEGEGPFIQNGNKMPVEEVRRIIKERQDYINSKIDSYGRTKDYLETLYPDLDKETLDNAIFLKEQISDHNNRLDSLIDELLPILNTPIIQENKEAESKGSESKSRAQEDLLTRDSIKKGLGNEIVTSILIGTLNDPNITLSKDEKDFAKKKLLDAITLKKNINKASEELYNILSDPSKSQKNLASNKLEATAQTIVKNLQDVTTVPQFRQVLSDLGYSNNSELINQLAQNENPNIASLAEAYQQITSIQKIVDKQLDVTPQNEVEGTGINAARQTVQRIINEANSTDEVITKLNEEIARAQENAAKETGDNASYEAIVASKLQGIVDSYGEAKKAKKIESKDKKSSRKIKDDSKTTDKSRKKPASSNNVDKIKSTDSDNAPSIEDMSLSELKQFVRKNNLNIPLKRGMTSEEIEELREKVREAIEKGNNGEDKSGDDDNSNNNDSNDNDSEIDFSELNELDLDEAIKWLNNLNLKSLSKADKAKVQKLLAKMEDKKKNPSGHESSDEDNSNADDNAIEVDSEPKFRSWGAFAKYVFQELNNRTTRQAVYNSLSGAQEQLSALEELGAFDFVDNGELGKLFKAEPDIQIKYIKAKDKRLADSILLAVEMTKERQKRAKAVRLITGQDGKQYQVVGMLGYSGKDVDAKANWSEVNKAITKERGKSRPEFFVSDTFYNKIKHIYSGRMVKSGDIISHDGTISGDVEDRSLKQMLHGVKPIIGVYYNAADFRAPALPIGADRVPLNTNNSNPREGSVWLLVQEADGRYYAKAIKVRRFNIDEYDLEEHKDSPILQQIREDLEIICNPEASDIDRYSAKYDLQEHLLYFPEGLDILYNDDVISITGVDWGNNIGKGLSPQEKAQELLKRLQTIEDDSEFQSIRFQIDTSELSDSDYVQELLDSDVMTSDLLQARNINASFDLYLNDSETGEPIESNTARDGSNVGHTGSREVNTDLTGSTMNIGKTEYTLLSDGRVMKKNQEITDPNIVAQVKLINNINRGLINPIASTNIYLGNYDDGTEFGIKKTKTSHTVIEGTKLDEAKEKAKKLAEKKKKRKTLKEVADNINSDKEDGLSDEELRDKARRGVFTPEAERSDDEGPSDGVLLRGVRRGVFTREEEQTPEPKPQKKGPKLIGLNFSAEETSAPTTTKGNLERLSRKRAARERIFGLIKDGKRMFNTLDDFYKYLQDEFSTVEINTQEDLDSVLNTIENCR